MEWQKRSASRALEAPRQTINLHFDVLRILKTSKFTFLLLLRQNPKPDI
jgi:hypothetical protein